MFLYKYKHVNNVTKSWNYVRIAVHEWANFATIIDYLSFIKLSIVAWFISDRRKINSHCYEKSFLYTRSHPDPCLVNSIYRLWLRRFCSFPTDCCNYVGSHGGFSWEKICTQISGVTLKKLLRIIKEINLIELQF